MADDSGNEFVWGPDGAARFRETVDRHPLRKDPGYGPLIRAVASEARKADTDGQYWCFDQGAEVVEAIMRAVNEDGWKLLDDDRVGSKKTFWYHKEHVRLVGKKRLEPYITVSDTQEAAAGYLRLPYRVPALDRILVDMLIASEMFAFADEVQPVLNKKLPLLLGWLLNNVVSVIVGVTIAILCFWLGDGATLMNWIGGIVLGATLLSTAWSLIAYPFYYPKIRAHHKKIEDMIGAMLDTYVAVAGRPASTKHIDEMIAKGTDKGVAWPAQLMVLMEDIRARSSTI